MNCVGAIDLMGVELDGALPADARPDFDKHLVDCPRCNLYFEQLRATVRTLRRLPHPEVPNPRRSELLERFRREPRRPS